MLAARRDPLPSLMVLRRGALRALERHLAPRLANLRASAAELAEGCLAVADDTRIRPRVLPLLDRD